MQSGEFSGDYYYFSYDVISGIVILITNSVCNGSRRVFILSGIFMSTFGQTSGRSHSTALIIVILKVLNFIAVEQGVNKVLYCLKVDQSR